MWQVKSLPARGGNNSLFLLKVRASAAFPSCSAAQSIWLFSSLVLARICVLFCLSPVDLVVPRGLSLRPCRVRMLRAGRALSSKSLSEEQSRALGTQSSQHSEQPGLGKLLLSASAICTEWSSSASVLPPALQNLPDVHGTKPWEGLCGS